MRLVEEPLQLVELFQGKVSPASPLLDFSLALVLYHLRVLFSFFHIRVAFMGETEWKNINEVEKNRGTGKSEAFQ